jgi:hypothetical protein
MKITSFYPMIITKDAENIKQLFEEMGFETRHDVLGTIEEDYRLVVMRDENKHRVDIAEVETENDKTFIRMNVDDFDEAYEKLIQKGYVNTRGDRIVRTSSALEATMVAPSGHVISLIQHKKLK